MKHNKTQNSLFNSLINFISAKAVPQILSLKEKCIFRFFNFLIIGVSNPYANCSFEIISLLLADLFVPLTAPPEVVEPENIFSKKL